MALGGGVALVAGLAGLKTGQRQWQRKTGGRADNSEYSEIPPGQVLAREQGQVRAGK